MADQPIKNSHYVARHLTKPWEFADKNGNARQLWVYDFDQDSFSVVASRVLHTTSEAWSEQVEQFLNRYLETPLAGFLARFNKNREAKMNEVELRAMKLTVMLQVQRTNNTIEDVFRKGESFLNDLVMAADTLFRFVHVPLRQERLFFPAHGVVMIPLLGAAPALAIPFHPSYLTAVVPQPSDMFVKQIEMLREDPDNFTAFSAGLAPCRRLVVPASVRGKHDESSLSRAIQEARERCIALTKTMLNANSTLMGTPLPKPPGLAKRK